jgi:uncharacterized protein
MFDFNDKKVVLTKAHYPYLVLLLAPIYLNGVDLSGLFKSTSNRPTILPITAQATVGEKAIKLEVAKTSIAQVTGLTHRREIEPDRGMLYETITPLVFSGKGMEFATDLIFIDRGRVVGFYTNVTPCTADCTNYSLKQPYTSVMEVKAGTVEKLKIHNDTEIQINYALPPEQV